MTRKRTMIHGLAAVLLPQVFTVRLHDIGMGVEPCLTEVHSPGSPIPELSVIVDDDKSWMDFSDDANGDVERFVSHT